MAGAAKPATPKGFTTLLRIGPALALLAALALLLAGLAATLYGETSYRAQKTREATAQAEVLAASITAALQFADIQALQEYAQALTANPEILAAGIYDEKGQLVAAQTPGAQGLPQQVRLGEPLFEADTVTVTVPVLQEGQVLGTVYLRALSEPLARRLARYSGIGLLVVMASLLVAVLGAAQGALGRANAEVERRATDLAAANAELERQMEERARAEEALRQAQKMEAIGQLSGGIAHDFNNLLTIVKGSLQVMQSRLSKGRTDVGQYIASAMDGIDRASAVTQRILAFSRRQPLSPRATDLSRLVLGMNELLRHSLRQQIAVDTRLASDWWTMCDANQMENVILNLAINARDAMPEGGRLLVETRDVRAGEAAPGGVAERDYVLLAIADTGTGMSPAVLERAIDPFFTTKPLGQGTGLGLSMVFGYVTQSGGRMHIDSQPGRGTTISLLMPRHEITEAELPAGAAVRKVDGAGDQAPTVLVVEDEALLRMLAVETLREEGYTVIEAGDGQAAWRILETDARVDLLMSDVKLPGMNGYQLAEAGMQRRPDLKILLMTGYAQDLVPGKVAEAGIPILYKPFNIGELAAQARRLLGDAPRAAE